jgi:hypothetical protein
LKALRPAQLFVIDRELNAVYAGDGEVVVNPLPA